MEKWFKRIAIILLVYLMGVLTPPIINDMKKEVLKDKVIYEITIDTEYINLREEVALGGNVIKQVYKGETFKVVKYYEGNSYNWYQVIYDDNKLGWLASGKDKAWVKVNKESNC